MKEAKQRAKEFTKNWPPKKKPTELDVLWNLKRECDRALELGRQGHSYLHLIQEALDLVDDEYEDPENL